MERNDRLRAAREATPSSRVPGGCASRTELAELANTWLVANTDRPGILDDSYIARLERGRIRWPNTDYRAALRAVLGALSDAELGFQPSGANWRPIRPLWDETHLRSPAPQAPATHRDRAVDITGIRAMATAFQVADRQVGGGVLYAQVLRYLNTEIGPRLVNANGSAEAGLFAAACSLTEIAGWMAHDGGNDDAARNHFGRAYRLAIAADYGALAGNVCASMSHLAGHLNQPADATRIAEVGLDRVVATPGTTRLVARLHTMRARALASVGDRHATVLALAAAERTLTAVGGEQSADWIAGFDDASLASETALCLRQLGDLAGARRHAERVIELRSGDRVRARAFGQLTLAGVLVDSGEIAEAATVGAEVCRVAASLTSARVRSWLERLGVALRPHGAVPEVTIFLEELAALTPRPLPDSGWPV